METVDIKNISFNEKGLVPAIVQDARSGEILMMAYMNQESLQKTIETGETWFFSRSRQKLWHKGEESAHFQHVKKIFVDCDADTLVVKKQEALRSFIPFLKKSKIAAPIRRISPTPITCRAKAKTRSTRRSAKKPQKSSSPTSIKTKKRSSTSPVTSSIICL